MATHTQTGLLASELLCPKCQSKGLVDNDEWRCSNCDATYGFEVRCDICQEAVQRLSGCGSSEHYYCRTCKTPKSRREVLYEMQDQ